MQIRVLAFATAAEILDSAELELELEEGATIGGLWRTLTEDYPELETLWPRLAIALDGRITKADDPLVDGAEVALLPPVSGGQKSFANRITRGRIDPEAVRVAVAGPGCGATVVFVGTVRNRHRDREVARLTYDAYPRMAEQALDRIVTELQAGMPGLRLEIVHRYGDLEVGEISVVIAAASPHRDAAYSASRTALERLKQEVPIWKREHYADGEIMWREEEPLRAEG